MVKASASTGAKSKAGGTNALRIDMKRKLPLPPPFVVSRGYTPDYPWLGQDHPAPKSSRPRLLMQQSCSGAAKAAVCVVSAVLGVALILYAGNAIIRANAERAALHDAHAAHGPGLHPQHAALVQEDPAGQDVVGALVSSKDGQHYGPDPEEHLADDPVGLRMVDPVLPENDVRVEDGSVGPAAGEDGFAQQVSEAMAQDGEASPGAIQATKHLLLWMRMANLVGLQREMEQRVQVTEALQGAYDKLQAAEAAMADGDDDLVVSELGPTPNEPTSSLEVDDAQTQVEDQPEDAPRDEHGDLQVQDTVDEDARLLMQWMAQAQPTEQELQEEPHQDQDTVDEDARLLAQWMRQASEQGVEQDAQQDGQQEALPQADPQGDEQGNQTSEQQDKDNQQVDDKVVHQILLWLTSSPQSWDVEQAVQEAKQPVAEAANNPVVLPPTGQANASAKPSAQPQPQEDPQPEAATTVVPWDQLNEDDKQDALLPTLAARGLDLHQGEANAPVATAGPAGPMLVDGADAWSDSSMATQVESDVPMREPQGELHGAPEDEKQFEAQQAQHYRHLVSQRFPLMYHVLHLRRSQQDALQQEQRATAYLRLLDLHLLQHQQEAEARRQQRQHQQDVLRLQRDEAQWAQQGQQDQQGQQSYLIGQYERRRPVRHLHGRVHFHQRHQHAF
ncbi:uncharacterized protein LOC117649635 [Thrips palmi]|uniref:Uncharacterized protein LOC117649635 n=1 Tax=Thrips palmi TaxID=161013 RepID=A0A6P8ZT69_THRPL|nr:uncharacterized protein LOC117649635 [Thrips palmi]